MTGRFRVGVRKSSTGRLLRCWNEVADEHLQGWGKVRLDGALGGCSTLLTNLVGGNPAHSMELVLDDL